MYEGNEDGGEDGDLIRGTHSEDGKEIALPNREKIESKGVVKKMMR